MSLVNDALRRATERHNSRPSAPVSDLPLRPVEPVKSRKTKIGLVLPATLLTIILAAIISHRWSKHTDPISPKSPAPLPIQHAPAAKPASPIVSLADPLVVSARELPPPPAPPAAAEVSPPPAPLAPLKLQALFYSPPHPSAIISGKTVFVGDSVRDMQVAAIGSTSVLLISATQTNFLRLE